MTVRGKGYCESFGNRPPEARCKDANVIANNPGNGCKADASIDDGSFDPDGDNISIFQEPEGPYDVGTTHVKLTVVDRFGERDTCFADVTVRAGSKCQEPDNKLPKMFCKEREQRADYPECTKDLWIDNGSTDYKGGPLKTKKQYPMGPYPLGTTEVTLKVWDREGRMNSCTRRVTVTQPRPKDGHCPYH